MNSPFALSNEERLLTSSLGACDAHEILFESAIHGLLTTEPNAGSLPIKGVTVEWELLTSDHTSALECKGCSGSEVTSDGGHFIIKIKADDAELNGLRNNDDVPIRIKYSKSTFVLDENDVEEEIEHIFLCNEGEDVCDAENGNIEFVSHMDLAKPLHIYDDTSVPFSGRIIHFGTRSADAPDGCPIADARVCLMHNTTKGVTESLVCVESDRNGEFVAPVVIGGEYPHLY